MKNIAYLSNPMRWDEYYGQEAAVNLAKKFIINGLDEDKGLPRSIYISGPSGVGKTAFVRLLMRSFRCLGRKQGEYEPCGVCLNCTRTEDERLGGRAYGDTIWLQPGRREQGTDQSQVNEALAQAAAGHTHTGRPDRDVLWIVFDEFQAFGPAIRQQVLLKSEVEAPNNNVCFVFISMREDKINVQDLIALIRRGCPIQFLPFTVEQISNYLTNKYPDAPQETIDLVSKASRNSLGLGLAYLERIKQEDESMLPDIAGHILQMASPTQRLHIWECLEKEVDFYNLMDSIKAIQSYTSPLNLATQFIEDILVSIKGAPTEDQLFAIEKINQFLQNYGQLSLLSYLSTLYGKRIVDNKSISDRTKALKYAI
jgi:hypothetical protein